MRMALTLQALQEDTIRLPRPTDAEMMAYYKEEVLRLDAQIIADPQMKEYYEEEKAFVQKELAALSQMGQGEQHE